MPATLPTPTYLTGDQVPGHLKAVEILSVGMDWPASTGPATFTAEHLSDIVRAANEDPHIQPPRVRLGHTSRLNAGQPQFDPWAAIGDAEPAFGRLVNLRLENDGAVLLADFDEVPDWLADGAPSLYPSRSAESTWEVEQPIVQHDVQTAGGKRYSAVLTAVALLGAYLPACQDLEDLRRFVAGGPTALSRPEGTTMSRSAELSVSADEVRQRFNFDWAMDPESVFEDADGRDIDPYWWWAREVRIGPEEVIADDDSGHLYRVPFSVSDRDEVLFGDPERVRVQYVAASGAPADGRTDRAVHVAADASVRQHAVSCFARRDQTVAASFTDRPDKPEPTAASTRPESEETTMPETLTPEQVERIRQLPEDADQAAIDAALTGETPAATTTVEPSTPPAETTPAAPAAQPEPVAATARLPAGFRVIDEDTLADLRTKAEAGANLAAETAAKEKADTIASAIREGRIAPARRAAFERMWDADADGARHLLTADPADGGLEPGAAFPMGARSHSNGDTGRGGSAHAQAAAKATELRAANPELTQAGAMQQVFQANPVLAASYQDEVRARAAA